MGRFDRRHVVGALAALTLAGCWDGAPSAPSPAPERPARTAAAPEPVAPSATVVAAEDEVTRALRQTPLAPSFYAQALGVEVDRTTKIDVSVTGEATLFEVDLADGPIPLRRARPLGATDAPGLFGRGWRSEVESCVLAAGEGALVVRVQGATPFVPLEGDLLVSLSGEVELLRRSTSGWELAAADGRVFTFDASGQLTSLEPGFSVERGPGRLALSSASDGAAARVVLSLDATGRVARVESDGAAFDLRHDPATGELLAVGDRRYELDARGRLVRARGLGIAHDGDDRVARVTRDDGATQTYTYTYTDGRADVSTPQGRFAYRLVEDGFVVDTPRGEDRAWLDARGRLVAFRRAGEGTQVFARDELEQPLAGLAEAAGAGDEVAHALGLAVTRDEAGRLTEVLTPAGRRWTFGWDSRQLVSTDGPAGPSTFTRDARGRLTSRRDASGREQAYELDAHGRPLSVAARTGEQVVWTRDEDGIVQAIESHDAAGRPARIAYQRDPVTGAVVRVDVAGGATLRYAEALDQDEVVTPWGAFVTTFDAQGQATTLETPAGAFRFAHDEHGRRTETEYPNGLVIERTRDEAGRVVHQVARRGDQVVSTLDAAWDERGDRTRATRDGVVTRYAHDARGRLARLERDGHVATWSWNDDADRTGEARDGLTRQARFDARGRIVTRTSASRTERFVHDEAGRLIERAVEDGGRTVGRDRFDYDGFGRLVRVARAGRPIVDYTYDPLGRLLTRTIAGEAARFVHDGERLLAEVGPGARERVYVWGPGEDEPLAWCERADADAPWRLRFVIASDLHTSMIHVDELGRVAAEDDLDPWGVGGANGRVTSDHPVFFAGRLVDPVSGLVPMRARWYDPSLGRFLTPDPAGLAAGPNAYVYVSGRPLDLVDPLGLQEAAREEPGLLTRFGRWVGEKAVETKETFVGATEGLGYLTGLRGTARESAAARSASWDDIASGRAQSRAVGAVDGYVQGLTFGLVDPNTSRFAHDPDQARRGRAYGDGGALAFGVINGAGAARSGARLAGAGLVAGARALPGAVRALPGVMRAVPGAVRAAPGVVGRGAAALASGARAAPGALARGVRAVPGLMRDGLGWLATNRGAIARAVGQVVGEQAQGVYRVTIGPFVSLAEVLLRPVRALRPAGRAAARSPRSLPSGGATTLVDDAARVGADDAVTQVAVAPPAKPQNGIVQVLGDGPPTATRAAPLPPPPPPPAPARAPAADSAADDLVRAGADDVVNQPAVTQPATPRDLAQVVDDAPVPATPAAPRPGQGAPQTPRAPPRAAPPAPRVEAVMQGEHAIAYHLGRGSQVGSGSLTSEGMIALHVDVPAAGLPEGQGYAREAIIAIHDALAASGRTPRGIQGTWLGVEGLDGNLKMYNAALAELSARTGTPIKALGREALEQATLETSTGKAAVALGYRRVQPGSFKGTANGDGIFDDVSVTFVH